MMKRTLFLSILIVFIISIVGCNKKEEYGLQDKCGKGSQEWFKTNYSHRETNGWSYKYTNHYNKKLNKCFSIVTELHDNGMRYFGLFEINENKEYGSCVGGIDRKEDEFLCDFLDNKVTGKKNWDTLVKPFMEE